MTVTIDLSPATEAKLREQAMSKGAKLEEYLSELAQHWANGSGALSPVSAGTERTPEQRVADLHAWAKSHSHITAVADDSRESIYEGCGE